MRYWKWIEFIARILAWAGALSVEATSFWRMTQEHNNLAFKITLCIVGLATLIVLSFDLRSKLRARHILDA